MKFIVSKELAIIFIIISPLFGQGSNDLGKELNNKAGLIAKTSDIENSFNILTESHLLDKTNTVNINSVDLSRKMVPGWNLGNSLEAIDWSSGKGDELAWENPKTSQELIDSIKAAGFNSIRIPCAWDSHSDQSTLEIDTSWLARVKEVIDYCYNNDLYVILNIHWDGGWLENNVTTVMQDTVNKKQYAYWTQIANHFKDYDEHLLFASANEPNVSDATQMAVLLSYHQTFVNAVRATGGNNSSRLLVIQGPSTDINKTNEMMTTLPTDQIEDRLIIEIHYYDPWGFCGLTKDESWGKMYYFWGKGFHSATITNRNSDWGEEDWLETAFQKMESKFVDKGIPVIIGEWGAIKRTSLAGDDLALHLASREYYYKCVTESAIRHRMVPIYWDNGHYGNNGFAMFDRRNGAIVDSLAVNAIIDASDTTLVNIGMNELISVPTNLSLMQNFPNPFNPSTKILYFLSESSDVKLEVYDILGNRIEILEESEFKSQGNHSVSFNANDLASGMYFYKLSAGDFSSVKKMVLLK